jgi:hypothetical protein
VIYLFLHTLYIIKSIPQDERGRSDAYYTHTICESKKAQPMSKSLSKMDHHYCLLTHKP